MDVRKSTEMHKNGSTTWLKCYLALPLTSYFNNPFEPIQKGENVFLLPVLTEKLKTHTHLVWKLFGGAGFTGSLNPILSSPMWLCRALSISILSSSSVSSILFWAIFFRTPSCWTTPGVAASGISSSGGASLFAPLCLSTIGPESGADFREEIMGLHR